MIAGAPDWSPLDLLPGLYTTALALGLAAALGRWYDPLPRRVLAVAGAVVCLLFGGSLFGGKVLLPLDDLRGSVPFRQLPAAAVPGNPLQGDLIELVVPSLVAARRGLAAGRWPLWNARVGAGMPLLADPQAQALAPLALAALPLPPLRGAAVMAALRVYLALVFTYLLLRRQGLAVGPALAGGLAFGLCGFVVLWVGWPLASAAALLPAVLYALVRVAAPESAAGRDALLLAGTLAALLLAGHPETILYACLLAGAFACEALWRCPSGLRRRVLGRYGAAVGVAAGLAAPALLPAVDYLPQTLRAERLAHPAPAARTLPLVSASAEGAGAGGDCCSGGQTVAGGGLAKRWLPIVAPNAYGNSRYFGYWGLRNTNEDAAGFAGTVMLLAALAAALPGAGRRRWLPGEAVATAAVPLCLLMLADPAPVHRVLLAVAPALAGSGRCLMAVAFCVAYLGACGLERHRRGELDRLSVLVAAAALAGVLAWGYLAHPAPGDPARLAVLRFGWLRWQARFLAGATLLLALPAGLIARRRGWRGLVAAGLAAAVAAELLLAHAPANPAMPLRLALPPPPLAVLTDLAAASGERIAALGRALPPNLASLFELDDARVYNPMAPAPYLGLLAPITAGWWGELPQLGSPDDPLYRRLGVRYLLTAPGTRLPAPWQLVFARPAGWIYRQPEVAPRLYLTAADAAGTAGPGPATPAAVTVGVATPVATGGTPIAPAGTAIAGPATAAGDVGEPQQGGLVLRLRDEQEIVARVRPQGLAATLASSVYQDGGWRLLIDRRAAPAPAAGRLLSAPLPPGAHRLDLLYRPRAFVAGLLLAALAVAAGIALWVPLPPPAGRGRGQLGADRSQGLPTPR
jgi:hypothetical protein